MSSKFTELYGDSYISGKGAFYVLDSERGISLTVNHSLGFVEGGEFLGIVSVKVIDDTKKDAILQT